MKRIALILVMFIRIATLTFCEIDIPEGAELADTNLWTPFVDVLRIRETPDLNGKVIATIKLGEQVEYIETSKNTSTVDYNGEKITDSWIKVKMKDGRIGWGWKGFMVGLKKYWDKRFGFEMIIPDTDVISLRISREEIDPGYYGAPFAIDWKFDEKTKVMFVYADPGEQNFTFDGRYRTKIVKGGLYTIQTEPLSRFDAMTGLLHYFMGYCILKEDMDTNLLQKLTKEEYELIINNIKEMNIKFYKINRDSIELNEVIRIVKKISFSYEEEIYYSIKNNSPMPSIIGFRYSSLIEGLSNNERELLERNVTMSVCSIYQFLSGSTLITEQQYDKIMQVFKKYQYYPQILSKNIPLGYFFYWLSIGNSKKYYCGTTVNNYLSDLKNNKGSYYAKKWYGSSEILFRSVKIYK